MNISEDISQEELTVFLEEADEQIKLLDEDLIVLEKNGAKPEILQAIFRAAHTLKGSSAMLGYDQMSRVAHSMETVLDMLRCGKLTITTEMINALLSGLDLIKLFKEKLVAKEETADIDIGPLIQELAKVANIENKEESKASKSAKTLNNHMLAQIQTAKEKGSDIYNIKVELNKDTSWASVRHFQLITELSQIGEIIECTPSKEDIENGNAGFTMVMVFASSIEKNVIQNTIKNIQDVCSVEIVSSEGQKESVEENGSNSQLTTDSTAKDSGIQNQQTIKKSSQMSESVRVDVKLLDILMNLVGEMAIDRNRIKQISKELDVKYEEDSTVDMLAETTTHMVSLVTDLQEKILKARMLHIGTILNGFPRLVRDLAQKANKKIDFVIEGQETELDRSIIEQIRDPLLHLLRNSVDHGIELPEKRKAAGKSETGTIKLKAYHEQSHIVVCISDDGGGINLEKVKKSAVQKGYITAEDAARLSVVETQNLIFLSGLSTAEKVSEVSGRGVGMDVVKTNVSSVGGSIFIDSEFGKGTTFTIRLPLTLATIDGILISSGGLVYVVPLSAIVEILRLKSHQLVSVMGREVFKLRENVIPIVRLNQRLAIDSKPADISDEINVIVIKVGDKYSGLVVDEVMEPQESVVKSLGKYIGSVRGISGATIMGDGTVALILDTATLVKDSQ